MTEEKFLQYLEERKREFGKNAPYNYDPLPFSVILGLRDLLFDENVSPETRETILFWLAHQNSRTALKTLREYNKNPGEALQWTARLALEECKFWN